MWRILSALAILITMSLARAQDGLPWVGQKVVTKYETPLKVDGRVVDNDDVHRIYTVERQEGRSLWITSEGVGGWVMASDVVAIGQAIDFYTEEINKDPNAWWAYGQRGSIWFDKGEYDKAIRDYSDSIRINPQGAVDRECRGCAWGMKKKYDEAIADFNEAIRISPQYALAYANRGKAWTDKKEYDKAISDLDKAIRLDPKLGTVFEYRGEAWGQKGEHDKALADFNEAIRLRPKSATGFYGRGVSERYKGDHATALADFSEAIRLDPGYIEAYINRGFLNFLIEKYKEAAADFDQAIRHGPNAAEAHQWRAWVLATCPDGRYRDGIKAVKSATRACELTGWKDATCLRTLAAAYAESGDFAKAAEWQEKANQLCINAEYRKQGEDLLKLYKEAKAYRSDQ